MSPQQANLGIVVGVDGSHSSNVAVEWAARDAEIRDVGLSVAHVVPPVVTAPEGWAFEYARFQDAQKRELIEHSYLVAQAHLIIEQSHKVALEASSPSRAAHITSEVLHGPIVPTLVNMSKQADMVVVGCRGQGAVAGALLGSVSSGLARHAHCPVAVIPDEDPHRARLPQAPVVVGIDGSPTSELAVQIAFDEASRRGVDLVALHAWSDMGPLDFPRLNWAPIEWRNIEDRHEKILAQRLGGWRDRYPNVVVRKVVVCDRPAPRLLELAQNAQLVAVGSHGRGGFPGMLLGSVSRAVVNSGQTPVIVARIPHDPGVPA
ncbi:universal stress protein [Mycobacterium decipiens]|uniref:Universal stress protein UspA n=1 Tax=Mycobacterium decipiens TaxID=1430326 RepID=A0A1X2LUB3_9MYCO|nr:universal stress protein [Mycobacterium decipiens]OSC40535.1 universal stress protein UspA [Mycobacterium decipiens]